MADVSVSLRLDAATYRERLEPFFALGRNLLTGFLRRMPVVPFAVLMCGGGSRIFGIRDSVLVPVLTDAYGVPEAEAMLGRVMLNQTRTDQAICLGAALIAGGVVQVQERLLCDIGIVISPGLRLQQALNIKDAAEGRHFLLEPILTRGSLLPALVSSEEFGIRFSMKSDRPAHLKVVVDDDPQNPLVQTWSVQVEQDHEQNKRSVSWQVAVDVEGVLRLSLLVAGDKERTYEGRVTRHRAEKSIHYLEADLNDADADDGTVKDTLGLSRLHPSKLREIAVAGKGAGKS